MIADNLEIVRRNIFRAAEKCGRNPTDIRLVAVSKTCPATAIREAMRSNQFLFGENYIQEAEKKFADLGNDAQFHFIGHLQSNKAKIAARIFTMIETVDRMKLALNLNEHLAKLGRTMDILIQVNIGYDDNKSGVSPENTENLIREVSTLTNLHVCGLMTMPPFFDDPERVRPFFRQLRSLTENLQGKNLFYDNKNVEISMGMSNDYPIAIEEGATLVRVGTAIFGSRL
jgi:PLP dependent protein